MFLLSGGGGQRQRIYWRPGDTSALTYLASSCRGLRRKGEAVQHFLGNRNPYGFAGRGSHLLKVLLNLDFGEHPLMERFLFETHHEQLHGMIGGGGNRRFPIFPAGNGNSRLHPEEWQ